MRRLLAVLYGLVCHVLFLGAVSSMAWTLHQGLQLGSGPLSGLSAWIANGLLILQFPLLHSLALTKGGARRLLSAAPPALRGYLFTTLFATFASLQLLATFLLWSPSGVIWWQAQGALYWVLTGAAGCAWLFLMKAMQDAGLGAQTGSQGWIAAWKGVRPATPTFPTGGTYQLCRQPIYLAFSLVLWIGPVMTPDRLALALTWTAYCLVGPIHKERRALRMFGAAFQQWQSRVPYFLPWVGRLARPTTGPTRPR